MRVSPEVLSERRKWQLPVVTALLAVSIIVVGVFSGLDTGAVVTQSNRVTKAQVAVARARLMPGEVFELTNVSFEVLPIELLPEDVLTDPADVIGKRAGVEIPEGTPLARWLLGSPDELREPEPEAVLPAAEPQVDEIPVKVLDAEEAKREILGR